ncbi:hypothetical protein MTO96_012143 [Rhipicephalus appendiculatus]
MKPPARCCSEARHVRVAGWTVRNASSEESADGSPTHDTLTSSATITQNENKADRKPFGAVSISPDGSPPWDALAPRLQTTVQKRIRDGQESGHKTDARFPHSAVREGLEEKGAGHVRWPISFRVAP